jgi:sensor histidine kinase regulating citrate/malate metabolism
MRQQPRSRQTGISFFMLIFVIAVLASVGLIGAQAFPTVLEYQAALKAVNKAKEGNTVPEVRSIFDKAAQIDDINSISGKDLTITKDGDQVVVSFAYNKEIHMFGPAYLLLKYRGESNKTR